MPWEAARTEASGPELAWSTGTQASSISTVALTKHHVKFAPVACWVPTPTLLALETTCCPRMVRSRRAAERRSRRFTPSIGRVAERNEERNDVTLLDEEGAVAS